MLLFERFDTEGNGSAGGLAKDCWMKARWVQIGAITVQQRREEVFRGITAGFSLFCGGVARL